MVIESKETPFQNISAQEQGRFKIPEQGSLQLYPLHAKSLSPKRSYELETKKRAAKRCGKAVGKNQNHFRNHQPGLVGEAGKFLEPYQSIRSLSAVMCAT